MTHDRVILLLPGVGTLVLDSETYRTALAEGAKLAANPVSVTPAMPMLVNAEELARLTTTKASWWEAAARELDCPSVFVGKSRRFNVADCMKWLSRVQERDCEGRVRRCSAVPRPGSA